MVNNISAGIYFVTNFFDDKEPLKWKLRTLVTGLFSDSVKDKSSVIKELSSLLALAKRVGLISDMNYEILAKEMINLDKGHESLVLKLETKESVIKDKIKLISSKKNTRQEAILSIIKNKKEVMIKDISSQFNGYSDKTIQRELFGMVKDGILIKSGEKRWSRYSLRG